PGYPNTSPNHWVDGYPCLPECSPHAKKPRASGAEFGGTSTLATAHAAPVNNSGLARPSRLRCDNYHKNALFFRVLQQMSACMSGRNARSPPACISTRAWPMEDPARAIQRKIKEGAVAAELSERSDVGRPEMFGGLFVPNISGSMGSDPSATRRWAGVDHEQCTAACGRACSATERRPEWT